MSSWQIFLSENAKDVHHCQCYNSLTGEVLSKPAIAINQSHNNTEKLDATEIKFTVSVETSSETLKSSMGIDATLKTSGLWGNVSAKSQYVEASSIDSFATYVSVYASLQSEIRTRFWDNSPSPVQEMLDYRISKEYDPKRWMKVYGDAYVRSVVMGGEFIAILRYNTRTEKEQSELKVQLDVAVRAFGFDTDISANFVNAINNVKTSSERDLKIIQMGGRKGMQGVNLNDLPIAAQNWTNTAFEHPVPIAIEVHTLDTIFPPDIPKPPEITRSTYEWASTINAYQSKYQTLVQETIPAYGAYPWRFHSVGMPLWAVLPGFISMVQTSLDEMNAQQDAIEADPFTQPSEAQQQQIARAKSNLQGMPEAKQGYRYRVTVPGQYLTADSSAPGALVHVNDLKAINELQIWTERKSVEGATYVGADPSEVELVNWDSGLSLVVYDNAVTMRAGRDAKDNPVPFSDKNWQTIWFWNLSEGKIQNGKLKPVLKNLDVDHSRTDGQVLWWENNGGQNQGWTREPV